LPNNIPDYTNDSLIIIYKATILETASKILILSTKRKSKSQKLPPLPSPSKHLSNNLEEEKKLIKMENTVKSYAPNELFLKQLFIRYKMLNINFLK